MNDRALIVGWHSVGMPIVDMHFLPETMFLRPRDPEDHAEWNMILPKSAPLCFYTDEDGSTVLRWDMPRELATALFGDLTCECCGEDNVLDNEDGTVAVDTMWDEVSWWFGQ
jgi:hypothetical protein